MTPANSPSVCTVTSRTDKATSSPPRNRTFVLRGYRGIISAISCSKQQKCGNSCFRKMLLTLSSHHRERYPVSLPVGHCSSLATAAPCPPRPVLQPTHLPSGC